MIKRLFSIGVMLLGYSANSQVFELSEKVDSIPLHENNRTFMRMVNKEFMKLRKETPDSILLFYPIEYTSNYAVIFWKRGGISKSMALYQYNPPKQRMGTEVLQNNTLNNISIKDVYDAFQSAEVRTMDTTAFVSHNNPIYFRFYFDGKIHLTAAYRSRISKLSIDFLNAFGNEQYRIFRRELRKSNVKKMPI